MTGISPTSLFQVIVTIYVLFYKNIFNSYTLKNFFKIWHRSTFVSTRHVLTLVKNDMPLSCCMLLQSGAKLNQVCRCIRHQPDPLTVFPVRCVALWHCVYLTPRTHLITYGLNKRWRWVCVSLSRVQVRVRLLLRQELLHAVPSRILPSPGQMPGDLPGGACPQRSTKGMRSQ